MQSSKLILIITCFFMALMITLQCPAPCHAEDDTANLSRLYETTRIELRNGAACGIKIMETNEEPLAFVIKCPQGFALCGSFNIQAMEKRKVTAVIFQNFTPKTFDAALSAPVADLTTPAKALGITRGMRVRDALEKMMADEKKN